jgi:Flp pilus assembly protein TadG
MRSLRTKNKDRDDRGVVALELAIVLPILLTLIIGVVVLGNALSVKTQTTGHARDGARAAALGKALPVYGDTVLVIVGAACPDPTDTDAFVEVRATKPLTLRSIPFLPAVLPAELTETVTMRCGG